MMQAKTPSLPAKTLWMSFASFLKINQKPFPARLLRHHGLGPSNSIIRRDTCGIRYGDLLPRDG
jgi:hypothetical protein